MNKLLAALIATLFAVGAFAADAPAKVEKAAAPAASQAKAKIKAKKIDVRKEGRITNRCLEEGRQAC